jgi:LysR family hydrogen peroxide-inducible transcriptional activator
MHLHQLKYFVAIVDSGSVTKAAEQCFISQPSISQQLAKLEDAIGKKLFSRVKGKLVLTDAGQVMYEQARKILADVEETIHRVGDVGSASGGHVSIGILPTLAPYILPSTLTALSQEYPDASVTIREEVSDVIVDAARRGELDILVEVLPFDDSHLDVAPLFRDEFYAAVHKGSELAGNEEIALSELDGMPFILLEDIHCMARQVEQYCFSERFMPKAMFQASQLTTVKHLIDMQYGVSILPSICIDNEESANIRYVRLKGEKPAREVVIATAKDRYLGPAAESFVALVKEQYQVV